MKKNIEQKGREEKIEIAKKSLAVLNNKTISEITGLSEGLIESLRKQKQK